MNWLLLQNSLLVSGVATLLAMAFGLAVALCLMGLPVRWRGVVLAASAVAFALPPFMVTNTWLHYLGYTGVWRGWLPVNLFSLGGTIWLLALLNWPITMFLAFSAWQRLAPEQLEADAALRGRLLLRDLLLPIAKPALKTAAILTLVLTLNNFAVPAILQTKVFTAEVWLQFSTKFDHLGALLLSWPLVIAPLLLLILMRGKTFRWPSVGAGPSAALLRQRLGICWWAGLATSVAVLLLSAGLPLHQLVFNGRTWVEMSPALAAGLPAVLHSFSYAIIAACLVVVAGLLIHRARTGVLLWLPFLLPGVLLGILLIVIFNRPALAVIYQSSAIVIIALTLRYLALGWQGARHALGAIDPSLTEAARLLGASHSQRFWAIEWPQLAPVLGVFGYVTYLLCLWDVDTLVLVMPPGGETLAVRVFNLLHYGHNAHVNALCVTLLGLAVLPLAGWTMLRRLTPALARRGTAMVVLAVTALPLATGCVPHNAPSEETGFHSGIFERVDIIGTRGAGTGQFNKPRALALDAKDNLYVVDMTGRVQKFSPQGAFLLQWQMPETDKGRPKGMCQDERGDVVVIEPHYSRVNHFDAGGKVLAQWGITGTNAGQLAFPRAVAINGSGDVYLCEYGVVDRVQWFSARGKEFKGSFGRDGQGNGEFSRAEGLGVDANGNVYVADSCNHRIQVFTGDGKFLRTYGRPGSGAGELSYPYDVRVDEAGRQYVCEFGNSRIQIFDAQDRSIEVIGRAGSAPGEFSNPWSIALDSHGNLFVADSMNHRVQKFIRRKAPSS